MIRHDGYSLFNIVSFYLIKLDATHAMGMPFPQGVPWFYKDFFSEQVSYMYIKWELVGFFLSVLIVFLRHCKKNINVAFH